MHESLSLIAPGRVGVFLILDDIEKDGIREINFTEDVVLAIALKLEQAQRRAGPHSAIGRLSEA